MLGAWLFWLSFAAVVIAADYTQNVVAAILLVAVTIARAGAI